MKFDTNRRGNKVLNYSRERKCEARTVVWRGRRVYNVGPDLSYNYLRSKTENKDKVNEQDG